MLRKVLKTYEFFRTRLPRPLGRLATLSSLLAAVQLLVAVPAGADLKSDGCGNFVLSQVESAMTGAGLLVWDSRDSKAVYVLTNSHLLQGRKTAKVLVAALLPADGRVVVDLPLQDIALLAIDGGIAGQVEAIRKFWRENAQVFGIDLKTGKKSSSWKTVFSSDAPRQLIGTVLDGQIACIPPTRLGESKTKDLWISGQYRYVYQIPFFGRHGMSGGVYFRDGNPAGIFTKLDLSPSSLSYAIPLEEASTLVRAEMARPGSVRAGQWSTEQGQHGLVVEWNGHSARAVTAALAGGETSNSGGETSNSGKGAAASADWDVFVQGGADWVRWADPFQPMPSALTIDRKPVAWLQSKGHFLLPNLARLLALKDASVGYASAESAKALFVARSARVGSSAFGCVAHYAGKPSRRWVQANLGGAKGCPEASRELQSGERIELYAKGDSLVLDATLAGERAQLVSRPPSLSQSSGQTLFTGDKGLRAVVFWDDGDLAAPERILIQRSDRLFELTRKGSVH